MRTWFIRGTVLLKTSWVKMLPSHPWREKERSRQHTIDIRCYNINIISSSVWCWFKNQRKTGLSTRTETVPVLNYKLNRNRTVCKMGWLWEHRDCSVSFKLERAVRVKHATPVLHTSWCLSEHVKEHLCTPKMKCWLWVSVHVVCLCCYSLVVRLLIQTPQSIHADFWRFHPHFALLNVLLSVCQLLFFFFCNN